MKKFFILSIILSISVNSSILSLDESYEENKTTENTTTHEEDPFDALIEDALEHNVKMEIPKPSNFELMLRKVGIVIFLKPYIFVVTKYRATKKFIAKCFGIIWTSCGQKK